MAATKVSKAKLLKSTNRDEYEAAGGNVDSAENQRILGQLVQRELGSCVSSLVHHFSQNEEALTGSDYSYEDILQLCEQEDWESSVREHANFVSEENGDIIVKVDDEEEYDDWREAAEALGIDEPQRHEAYEHWIVSDWLADKLKGEGEITGELFNLTIWGRCTSGQSISMDGVIARIAAGMQILQGQKNDWSGK